MGLTRGRVLPAAEAHTSLASLAPLAPPSPLRRAAQVQAHDRALALVAGAHEEAAATLRAAADEAAALRKRAVAEGQAEAEAALAARWVDLKRAEETWHQQREGDLLAVARLLAERLLLRSLDLDPRTITDLTRQALAPLRRARRLLFSVHPDDAEALRAGLASLGHDAALIEVHLEPTAPRGAVHIVSELGSIRAELAPQLDRLLAALRAP